MPDTPPLVSAARDADVVAVFPVTAVAPALACVDAVECVVFAAAVDAFLPESLAFGVATFGAAVLEETFAMLIPSPFEPRPGGVIQHCKPVTCMRVQASSPRSPTQVKVPLTWGMGNT